MLVAPGRPVEWDKSSRQVALKGDATIAAVEKYVPVA